MSKLKEAMETMTYTENGALTYNTTSNKVLDLFAMGGALRSRPLEDIRNLVLEAYQENPEDTLKVLLYLRDCRNGMGERKVFTEGIKAILSKEKLNLSGLYTAINNLGYLKDLFNILDPASAARVIKDTIKDHLENRNYTLLEKWMPSIGGSSNSYAEELAKNLGMTPRQYRKYLSKARANLKIVESSMCSNSWESINYEHVPAKAGMNYAEAFLRHDRERYKSYLESVRQGTKSIKTTGLYPYEIVRQADGPSGELLWNNLPDYTDGRNALVVCDVSGSMTCNNSFPLYNSVSLGLYFAERNTGIFHNEFITFSETPKLQTIKGTALKEKLKSILDSEWGFSTNLIGVFDLILNSAVKHNIPEEEMPGTVYVISDMEFNDAFSGKTNLDEIKEKYNNSGYQVPRLVFWNANSRQDNVASDKDEQDVVLISGSSPTAFSFAVEPGITPLKFMRRVIDTPVYIELAKEMLKI